MGTDSLQESNLSDKLLVPFNLPEKERKRERERERERDTEKH